MRPLLICTALAIATLAWSGCTGYYEDTGGEAQDEAYYDDGDYGSQPDVVFQDFDDLSFWGQWMELYPYGEVWRPSVVVGWRPYTNGYWIWTDMGWTWVSYEPFGWATYHYGMWVYDIVWGWLWIPGYTWSPACVDWAVYDDYVAWAPCHPDDFYIGEPWNVTEVYVWQVVLVKNFTQNDVGRYGVRYKSNYRVRNRSTVIYHAPTVDSVERYTGKTIRAVPIELKQRAKVGDRTIKQLRLPPTERDRIARYRERVEEKLRTDRDGIIDDRIRSGREDRTRRQPQTREEPRTRKEPQTREEPVKKKEPDRPVKQKPDQPQKQEPRKKEPDRPVKQKPDQPKKQEPRKKEPDRPQKQEPKKKEPRKKEPEKKPPREPVKKKPRKG